MASDENHHFARLTRACTVCCEAVASQQTVQEGCPNQPDQPLACDAKVCGDAVQRIVRPGDIGRRQSLAGDGQVGGRKRDRVITRNSITKNKIP